MVQKLKRIKVIALFVCVCAFFFASCKTTDSAVPDAESKTVLTGQGLLAADAAEQNPQQKKDTAVAGGKKSGKKDTNFTPENFTGNLQKILQKGDIKRALAAFEEIPGEHKDNPDLNYLHASLLLSAGDVQKAAEKTQLLVKQKPNDENIQLLSAMVAKAGGDNRKSTEIIRSVLKKDPANPDANAALANTFMLVRNFKQANLYFQKGLEKHPEHPACLFGFGQTSWYLNQTDTAKKAFTKLTLVEPENDMAWAYLAKLAGESRNYAQALTYIQKALTFSPDNYHHRLDEGSYYLGVDKYEEAEKAWAHAIKINPDYFLAYTYRGGLRDERGRYKEALEDYRNVIRCNPKYYYAYESVAMLAWRTGNWEEALQGFLKASEMNPQNVSYKLMVSACYQKMNNTQANKDFLSTSMKNMDKQSLDYLMLRLYYDKLSDGAVLNKVVNENNRTAKGKMLFYMALFYELTGKTELANKIYLEVADMQEPLFFEYRLTQWAIEKISPEVKSSLRSAS